MKNLKKIAAVILAVVITTTVFAGCGNSGKVKVIDIPLSEEEYAFAVSQTDTEFLSSINAFLAEIKANGKFDEICNNYFGDGTPQKFESATLDTSKKQLVVATATGFEPFEMVDENKQFYGIDMEIAKLLGEKLGLEVVIQDMDFDAVVSSVQSGKCNIAMAGLSVTPERQKVVTFTDSYYNASQVVVVNEENTEFDNCKTKEDVVAVLNSYDANTKIGCQQGTTGELYIKGDKDYEFDGLKATPESFKLVALAITAMTQGKVSAVIVDNGPAKAVSAKINGD